MSFNRPPTHGSSAFPFAIFSGGVCAAFLLVMRRFSFSRMVSRTAMGRLMVVVVLSLFCSVRFFCAVSFVCWFCWQYAGVQRVVAAKSTIVGNILFLMLLFMTVVFNVCSMQKYKIILSVVCFSPHIFDIRQNLWYSMTYAAMI